MSFRDDRDALLARADAADAEAERLRADNARLRRDLERAGEAPAPAPVAPPPPESADVDDQTPPGTRADSAKTLAARALISRGAELLAAALTIAGATAGVLAAHAIADSWLILVGLLVGAGVGLALGLIVMDEGRRGQERWLDRLALPLDRAAYARLLGVGRVRRRVTVRVRVPSLPEPARRRVVEQLGAVEPETEASWDGDRLEVHSPWLTTWRQNKYGAAFHNAPVHAWFRRVIERGLLPALDGHRVEQVEIG